MIMADEKITKTKKRKTVDTWKKKQWYTIVSPAAFEEREVATTVGIEDKNLIDRIIKVPYRDITNNMNHQFVKLILRITEIKGLTAHTTIEGFEIVEEFLRRNIRRRRSIIKTVRTLETSDKKKVRLTAHAFTARKIDSSQKKIIRKIMDDFLTEEVPKMTFDFLIQKSISGAIPTEIAKRAKEITPIKRVEMSKCWLMRG